MGYVSKNTEYEIYRGKIMDISDQLKELSERLSEQGRLHNVLLSRVQLLDEKIHSIADMFGIGFTMGIRDTKNGASNG